MTHFTQCHLCSQFSGGCNGRCNYGLPPMEAGRIDLPPKGCICPPTSEKTCQRWDCGRKDMAVTTSAGTITIRDGNAG